MPQSVEQMKILITGDSADAEKSLDAVGHKAGKMEKAVSSASNKMKVAATAAAVAGAALAVAFTVAKTKEFEKSISELSAITGASGKDLDFLSGKALEFGANSVFSAAQAAEAFKLVASAKPDLLDNADALARVTKETITLAQASGMDLPAAASALGASLNQFNADASESSRFINVLAAGAKYGASEIGNTAEALKVAGTVASSVGLSFEQTNAAIQTLAGVAIKGSEAGTGLRGVLLKLSIQSRDEFNPEVVGFTEAMKNLADAHLTTTEKAKLFGQESITAANALIGQADSLDVLIGKLTKTDTAYKQAATRVNNLDGDMKLLNSTIEAQAILAGKKMDLALRVLVRGFNDVISVEKQTKTEMDNTKRSAEDLALTVGKVADAMGNAANGMILPFEIVGSTIGAVAARISALAHGDFQQVVAIGKAYGDDMKAKFDKLTDPLIASRYENIARRMIAANDDLQQSNKDTNNSTKPDISTITPPASVAVLDAGKQSTSAADAKAAEQAQTAVDNIINLQQVKFTRLHEMALAANGEDELLASEKYVREYEELQAQRERIIALVGDDRVRKQELNSQFNTAEEDLLSAHLNNLHKLEQSKMSADEKLWASGLNGRLQLSGKVLGKVSALMHSENRKMFETGKAAARAQNAVHTYLAATEAYSSMAGIPIVGPALGAAAAAAAVMAGLQNDRQISRQHMGGGAVSGSSSVPSISAGGGANAGGGSIAGGSSGGIAGGGNGQNVIPFQLHLNIQALHPDEISPSTAQMIGEHLSPYIQDAMNRGYGNRAVA